MKLITATCTGIAAFLSVFAFTAFVIWNTDMSTWLPVQRFVTAALAGVFGGVCAAFVWEKIK